MTPEQQEEEKIYCYGCGKELKDDDECFIDGFFAELLGGVFCSQECRDDYIDSK